jgi:nucleoside-diphosphate-sugar epimerase
LAGVIAGQGGEIRRLTGNLVVDASRARDVLGWRPRHTLDAGLEATALWFSSERG